MPTGHLFRMWNGQRCTLVTASHPCLSVPQRSTSHSPCTLTMHTGIFLGYALYAGRIWKGNIMVADTDELEEMDASELHA